MKDREPQRKLEQPAQSMYQHDKIGFFRVEPETGMKARPIDLENGKLVYVNQGMVERARRSREDTRTYPGYPNHKKQHRL